MPPPPTAGRGAAVDDERQLLLSNTKQCSTTSSCHGEYGAEARSIAKLAVPLLLTGILLYLRSMVSMLFLGRLGPLSLAGGSLALGFANITGYSVLSGLAAGMDPICAQAFGAGRPALLNLALRRTILLLLAASAPIALLWLSMRALLLLCGQHPDIAAAAHSYILFSLPDLAIQSFLHPTRIYLRAQSITAPLTNAAFAALLLHIPANFFLVTVLRLGVRGVALAAVCTNLNLLLLLLAYLYFSSGAVHSTSTSSSPAAADHQATAELTVVESVRQWKSLTGLAVHSCVSVCLEWWWYEIMVLLCGLLPDPKAAIAAMGILIQTTSLIYIFPHSLSNAVSTRAGNELGAGRTDRASRVARVGLAIGIALGLSACAFAACMRTVWARLFTADADIIKLVAATLPILGLAELGNCPQTTGCGVLRGSARPSAAAAINVSAFYGIGMPVAVALAFWRGMGLKGMWLGMLAAQAACAALMIRAVRRTNWAVQAERAKLLTRTTVAAADEEPPADEECGSIKQPSTPAS